MKLLRYVAIVLAVGCGGEEASVETPAEEEAEEAEPVEETPDTVAAISFDSVPTYFGGARIAAGAFAVELLPQSDGAVKAYVSKEDGTPVQNAELNVSLQGVDGAAHPLSLSWDASAGAYLGTLDTKPVAGAVSVSVSADGASGASSDATINVASPPVYGGHTVLVGNVATEVVVDAGGAVLVNAWGPEGSLITGDELDLSVGVEADDGNKYSVPLAWDADANVYAGLLPDDIHPASGALDLSASFGGASYTAGFPTIVVATPSYEGDVVAVGDLSVELVAGADGALKAYVSDAEGNVVTGSDADIALKLPSVDADVDLAWDADANAYVYVLPVGVDISTAPLGVRVRIDGRVRRGGIAASAGRSLGVAWRERLESGAGGAIPPGQAPRMHVDAEFRTRLGARGRGRSLGVGRGGRMGMNSTGMGNGMGMGAVMVGVEVNAPRVEVEVGGGVRRARGAAAAVKARGQDLRESVMVPMVSVMGGASASGGASAMGSSSMGGASAMGGASIMLGF